MTDRLRLSQARQRAQAIGDAECFGASLTVAEQAVGRTAELDYTRWGRRFLPHLFPVEDAAMHSALDELWSELAERRGARENILGHRKLSKTTRTRPLVLRSALEFREPYQFIVMDSFSQAEQQLANIKHELEHNAEIRAAYPLAAGVGPKWRDDFIILPNGARIDALGTGQKVRGRIHLQSPPTLIICDDLQNDEQVQSQAQREKAWSWFSRALLNAGEEAVLNVVNLASTLHPEAIALRLKGHGAWTTQEFPAFVSWPDRMELWGEWEQVFLDVENCNRRRDADAFYQKHKADMDRGAVVQWPGRYSILSLMMRRTLGHAAFDAEMQCNPIDPEVCEFDPAYFEDVLVEGWPPRRELTIKTIAIDPSKGRDARRGDYSAIVKLGRAAGGLLYIEADLARRTPRRIVQDGIAAFRSFQPDAMGCEGDAMQDLLLPIFDLVSGQQGDMPVPVSAIYSEGVPKPVRIRRLDSYLARRLCRFIDTPGTRMLLDQLRYFPQAEHDDGPDALEMALRLAIMVDHGRTPRGDPLENAPPLEL